MNILSLAIERFRSTFCIALLIILAGLFSRANTSIEAFPDIAAPFATVSVFLDGVSPEDGARLLVRPLEKEVRTIEGVVEITATARESIAYLVIEFEPDLDMDDALVDLREAVDRAKVELPQSAEEPIVREISSNEFPAIVVALSGENVSERVLFQAAKFLEQKIESIPDVLSADISGSREEVLEIVINPERLEYYGITSDELASAVFNNNLLIPAGQIDDGSGKFSVKVPGLIESASDLFGLPIKATASGLITLSDVAKVRRTFKDAETVTSVRGQKTITLSATKRTGTNLIEVVERVREVVGVAEDQLPGGVEVSFLLDQSPFTTELVSEMQGNIVTAMGLVMVIVVAALGFRSGMLVGLGIPFSLLFALAINYQLGYSFNFMVMFGMLLALGMLIDGAIVVTEYADRKMAEGMTSGDAYQVAVKRMFWPVAASTATTLAAFLPLMLWPGVVGEFMRFLPVTVFSVLAGSLLYALFFAPVLGAKLGRGKMEERTRLHLSQLEQESPEKLGGLTGRYTRFLLLLLRRPVWTFASTTVCILGIFGMFLMFSSGVEFYTDSEDPYATVTVRAQGNFSAAEMAEIVQEVEQRVLQFPEVFSTYTNSGSADVGASFAAPAKDTIGTIFVELYAPDTYERKVREVFAAINDATADMPGIFVNAFVQEAGPPVGKPVQIQLQSTDIPKLVTNTRMVSDYVKNNIEGLRDVVDSTPLPGIEWQMKVDRGLAAQMGASISEVGRAVQLVTNGVLVGDYRPDNAEDEVDIRVRFPEESRGISQLDLLRVNTPRGAVPISTFVSRQAEPEVDVIRRVDGVQVMTVTSDVQPGVLADDKVKEISEWLETAPIDPEVTVVFRGANEQQAESFAFLGVAFILALFLMFVLLVAQFNSFYQGFLILSSVVMSTAGVMLGLVVSQATFSVILTGVGIVALAGIVVNNNIVLIDTYNHVRKHEPALSRVDAAAKAAAQRLRPVFLTTVTTILGLLPIAMNLSVDLIGRDLTHGSAIASNWQPLASAIVNGLAFSTLLTLLVTPIMLVLPEKVISFFAPRLIPSLPSQLSFVSDWLKKYEQPLDA